MPSLFQNAIESHNAGAFADARRAYEAAIAAGERVSDCWANLAVIGIQTGDAVGAKSAAEKAIALNPADGNAHNNLGLAHKGLQNTDEAIAAFQEAVRLSPEHGIAWANLAGVLGFAERWEDALEAAERAYALVPDYDPALEMVLYIKLETGSWSGLDEIMARVDKRIRAGGTLNPYTLFSVCVDPGVMALAGRNKSESAKESVRGVAPRQGRRVRPQGRIRVGYFSANIRSHATGYLIREMIRLHDRERFEIFAIPYSRRPEDDFTRDLLARFDRVIDVSELDNAAAVEAIRALELDVMIDVNGHADGGRTAVSAARCAPLQVAWLGYAAPMGADFIDYTISDPNVTPDALVTTFPEAVLRLRRTYYPSDPVRPVSERFKSRDDLGLPEDAIVFCAFNQTRKITPPVLQAWCAILKQVPESVLWLWELNAAGRGNITETIRASGIDPARVVWVPSLPSPDHLCRYRFADVYLDTFPYNGHTMVSDALYMGLPVVTLAGRTMPSRVAGSFLALIGAGGLIAKDLEDYVRKACALAANADLRHEARDLVLKGAQRAQLFSAEAFVRDFEAGLSAIVAHARSGNAPATITIPLKA